MMKKSLMVAVLAVACSATAFAQSAAEKLAADKTQISLADARGKIDKAVESPAVMKEILKRLSAADQKQFLADVNKAIGDLPASPEEKAAKYLNVNHAALTVAQKGNTAALLAEVFATVSPEALSVINERFAQDLVNRAANPNVTYTDEQFTKLAVETMNVINERVEATDNGSPRAAFAILMFLRASNGTPVDLADKLVDTLKHDDVKELAKNEWIPVALGKDGREQSYEPILAAADAGLRPDYAQILVIAGPQQLDAILADINGKNTDLVSFSRTHTPVLDATLNPLIQQVPVLGDDPSRGPDAVLPPPVSNPSVPEPQPQPPPHPGPYGGQGF